MPPKIIEPSNIEDKKELPAINRSKKKIPLMLTEKAMKDRAATIVQRNFRYYFSFFDNFHSYFMR